MDPEKRESLKESEKRENITQTADSGAAGESRRVEVYAEKAETDAPEMTGVDMQTLALAYAKYLAQNDMEPGEATFVEPEDLLRGNNEEDTADITAAPEITESAETNDRIADTGSDNDSVKSESSDADAGKEKKKGKRRRLPELKTVTVTDEEARSYAESIEKSARSFRVLAAPMDYIDSIQENLDLALGGIGRDLITAGHRFSTSYRQSRRVIGTAILMMGVVVSAILMIFNKYTIYEYSYNGKVLGYVKNQDDVIEVLDIAGRELTANSTGGTEIKFTPNQNVTFRLIDSKGKSVDSADVAVNKLVYMTDIETEAYGVYDGDRMVAVVKSEKDAERLINQTMEVLSEPDEGMKLVSAEFTNDPRVAPVNVLLTSVQSNDDAKEITTQGGSSVIYHIVEEGETINSLAQLFCVDPSAIFDENNKAVAVNIEMGDKVCIHQETEPVSIEMVEKGKMTEILEYETVKKESADYYQGDTHLQQDGVSGVQSFEGTVKKVGGEIVDRKGKTKVIRKKKNKIILVGTAERPKTAPTGTYIVPLKNFEGISSGFGYRWGRLHSGIDMGASYATPIYAADGGTVQRAGWYYGYGLCVEIDHGNGVFTRYGHCSSLLVNAGDKVYQGQNIALVGSTGHSFGNHLHFEININGTPVNPAPYIGF